MPKRTRKPAAATASDKYAGLAAGLRALMKSCPPDKLDDAAMRLQMTYMNMTFHTLVRNSLRANGDIDMAGAYLSLMAQARSLYALNTFDALSRARKGKKHDDRTD